MNTTITHQNGRTVKASAAQTQKLWNKFLTMTTLWEIGCDDEDQARDLRPMILDYSVGRPLPTYDVYDYGEGREGDTFELEQRVEAIDKKMVTLRFEIRKAWLDTSNRIELAKQGRVSRFSWRAAWDKARDVMRRKGAELRALTAEKWAIVGELRARETESHPERTVYMTSDMTAACSADEQYTER